MAGSASATRLRRFVVTRPGGCKPLLAFDLMDTVVVDPFFVELPKRFGRPLEELVAHRDPMAWPAFERGEIDELAFLGRFYPRGVPSGFPSPEAVRLAIVEGYRFVEGMPRLLERLRGAGVELWVFSNYPVWFQLVLERLKLERWFDGFVVSFQTGARKPDESAYRAFCERTGRPPSECLLIDDRQANVDAARAFGMQALRFETVERLERAIEAARIRGLPDI